MRASKGSAKKVKDIIGREQEMKKIWRLLKKRSVVIASLRRMGKTCILQKMCEFPDEGKRGINYFVQGKQSPEEFVDGLYKILIEKGLTEEKFTKLKAFYNTFVAHQSIGSLNAPELKSYWKDMLEKVLEDLAGLENNNIVIMIDEFPMMLWEFVNNLDMVQQAKELLDTLRKLREQYERDTGIRFIFCGSIGMNVILDILEEEHRYTGEAINNMTKENVLEMSHEDTIDLCNHLCPEELDIENRDELFSYIATHTDQLPFFIDHVFTNLQVQEQETITEKDIDRIIDDLINDPNNNNEFDHFYKRIKTYYRPKEKQTLALDTLDFISRYSQPVEENTVISELVSNGWEDRRMIRDILKQLYDDLYLLRKVKNDEKQYCFRYNLLRKWWKLNYA